MTIGDVLMALFLFTCLITFILACLWYELKDYWTRLEYIIMPSKKYQIRKGYDDKYVQVVVYKMQTSGYNRLIKGMRKNEMLLNISSTMWLIIAVTMVVICLIRIVGLVMFIRNRDDFKVVDLSEHVWRE